VGVIVISAGRLPHLSDGRRHHPPTDVQEILRLISNHGRSRYPRQRKTLDGHAFNGNRRVRANAREKGQIPSTTVRAARGAG
jgi:hypothetical protein